MSTIYDETETDFGVDEKPKRSRLRSMFTSAGSYGMGAVGCLVMLSLPVLFLVGAEILGEFVLPWLLLVCPAVVVLSVVVIPPLTIFRTTRPWAGLAMVVGSHIFGLTTWLLGFVLTLTLWGMIAVIIGLFLLGVGVVPFAMLATGFNGMWLEFGILWLGVVLTFGYRILGHVLMGLAERDLDYGT